MEIRTMDSNISRVVIIAAFFSFILASIAGGEPGKDDLPNARYSIVFSGHWNSLRNGKMNDYYIPQLNPEGDKINSGYGFSSEFRYYISRRISLGGGIIFIKGSSDLKSIIVNINDPSGSDTLSADHYIKTRLLAPTISIRYHVDLNETDISIGIGESYLLGKASNDFSFYPPLYGSPGSEYSYSSTGMGFLIMGAIDYRLSKNFSYLMEMGYRKFTTGDLFNEDDNLAMKYGYVYNTGVVNLDYSGPYISAGLMFRIF